MSVMTGKEALVQILRAEGVEYVFGIPGATEVQFIDILEEHPELKYVLCLHESVAVGMAEGYARISGKVGFLNLHTNTGLAAGAPLLVNAYCGGVPLVVTVGQQDTRLLAEEPAMSGDLVKIASPFTKWATEVIRPADLPAVMRRAFKVATHPPTGPVMVSLPLDVLAGTLDFEPQVSDHAYTRLRPDDRAIEAAVGLVATAVNPAIVVEDGVTRCDALAEVVRFAEQIGARVYQPWMADVNFPVDHPQYMGDIDTNSASTRELLEEVDVLVGVGALLFQQAVPTPEPLVPSHTKIIQIDEDPWQIAKNFPVACGVQGDIKVALADLSRALEARLTPAERARIRERVQVIAAEKQASTETFADKVAAEWDNDPISGTRFMSELRDALEPGTRIVDDCWSYSALLRRIIPFTEARSYLRSRAGGSIGGGLPTALGVKLASPDRSVVCVSGDGSAMWSIQSLWNAVNCQLPVTFIVLANDSYRQVRLMKTRVIGPQAKGRDLGTTLRPPKIDFCKIAEGMGLAARRVTRPGDLGGTLREALTSAVPNVVEVAIDPAF